MLEGRLIPSMSIVASALRGKTEDLDAPLRLLLRDDLVSWYVSKSMAKSDAKTQELEKQLADRIVKNAIQIQSKFGECAVRSTTTNDSKPVNQRVRDLVREASSHERLCTMPSTFYPWL